MPRQNHGIQGLIPGKIRKRGCSSSSSTSSVLQKYRFKRAILVGKRGGSSTPVPTWRLMNSRSPASAMRAMESPRSMGGGKAKQAPVSARKLAATLWEMNEMPSPRADDEKRSKREVRGRERVARSLHSGSLPPHLSDPSHSPVSEVGFGLMWIILCYRSFSLARNWGEEKKWLLKDKFHVVLELKLWLLGKGFWFSVWLVRKWAKRDRNLIWCFVFYVVLGVGFWFVLRWWENGAKDKKYLTHLNLMFYVVWELDFHFMWVSIDLIVG